MLQANKDKMSSSKDDFTPLSELAVGMSKCRVRVRVSRLWESFNLKNDDMSFGLDCLLIDDQGGTMHARVLPDDIDQFEGRLIEGKVYVMSGFTVDDTRDSYMTSNEFTIYFRKQTVVNEIEVDIDLIPLHSFEFIDFKNLQSRCDDNSVLTDVLGHIVYVGNLHEVEKKSRTIEICYATIQNLSGRRLGVTLYGDIACGFAEDMLKKGNKTSVVAVFAGMHVESSQTVCSTTCSKCYLDLEIPEVQEFCVNLRIQLENPIPEKGQAQKIAESWRTVEQLKQLNPKHMLQADKDKMGSFKDDFTPLSELAIGMNKYRVRVRVSRLWESFNPKNDISFGLDCLLIDDQGETMQARVLPDDIDQFEGQLIEGKVYALSNFTVDYTRESYMTCSNEFTIYFGRQTVVNEIEDNDSIHLHSFEFIDFKNLDSRCDDNSILTDVLGHIVYVGGLQENEKKSRTTEICNATIQNLCGKKLGVTLYGDIACGFAKDMLKKGQKASVVAVFAGMHVESSDSVCSTTCSKYYLDLEIPEVQEFCKNLRIQQENPIPEKTRAQKLAESWRTVQQLKRLNPKDYDKDTMFLCRVSLIDIDCTSKWCYLGCDTCQKSMYRAPRKYKCSRCGPIKRPVYWYKLKTKVRDETGTMNLMIFCEVAEELVGVSAEELLDENEDDELPDQIKDLLGSTHTFRVFDNHLTGSFSVYSIMDDDTVSAPSATTSECEESDEDMTPSDSESVSEGSAATTSECEESDEDTEFSDSESESEGSVNAAVPSPATTQCKVEPALEDSAGMAAPAPTMIPCKEEPVLENFSMVVPAPTMKHECKEEPVLEHSVTMAVPMPTTAQCKEEPVPVDNVGTGEARLKSTRLKNPNKRLRGDDWIN